MPATSIAARRYAEAIYQLAEEGNALDQWQEELDTLAAVVSDEQVLGIMQNEKAPLEGRANLLTSALGSLSPLARNLASLLLTRGKLTLLPEIARLYGEKLDERNGVVRAQVTTAVPLAEDDQREIADRLKVLTGARDIRLQTAVDPAIIGGLVARVGDKLIDGSTRSRLIQLRRDLAGQPR
jgi:F-type H+-transporting ATPase subunit delta